MTLSLLIATLRRELQDELPRMHSRAVPAETVPIQVSRYDGERWQPNWDEWIEVLDAGEGPPFNPMFVAFLDGEKGTAFLAQSSISKVGVWCHAQDLQHCELDGCSAEGGAVRTPLCERIVAALVERGEPIGHIVWQELEYRGIRLTHGEVETLAIRRLKGAASWRHSELHRMMAKRRENQRDTLIICPLCLDKRIQMRRVAA